MTLFFQKVNVIDSQSQHHNNTLDVLVKDGFIQAIGKNLEVPKEAQLISGKDLHLSPGLFDLQVNFRDPGLDWKEDIISGSAAAVKGGVTGVLIMPSNAPSTDSKVQVDYILNKAKNGLVDVIPAGNVTKDHKGHELSDMFEMSQAGAKAFTDDRNSIQKADVMKLALLYTKNFEGMVMNQANDSNISANGKMNEGITSTTLGLKGIPALAEEVMLARDIELAEYTGGKLHTSRISTQKSVEMIRAAKKRGVNITADVAIHHLILTDQDCHQFDSNFKVFPPLRTPKDIEALKEGIKDGTIDAICSDHYPEDPEHKILTFDHAQFGIIGLQTLFPLACELIEDLGLSTLIDVLSINPRKILGLESPKIEIGQKANLCCYSTNSSWQFLEEHIVSKSINTPFINRNFNTKVLGVVNGLHTSF
jgi:dihydroorotase